MSWRWEILTDQWMTCGLCFATKEEAEASVFDLTKGFYETRVTETDDPVNHRWVEGQGWCLLICICVSLTACRTGKRPAARR